MGTNLSLAVSQNLAILMHGCIEVSSLGEEETEFQIRLPLMKHWELPQLTGIQERLKGKTVLLVKAPDILQGVSSLMRRWQMDVNMTSDTSQAKHWMEDGLEPEIAVIDMGLEPDKAMEFIHELKGMAKQLPIIILVPYGMHMVPQETGNVNAVLTKPVRQLDLLNALSATLHRA
ncbi:hybrid sensory histidine kinase TorS [compost metagenome]